MAIFLNLKMLNADRECGELELLYTASEMQNNIITLANSFLLNIH